jgi:uncharacterized membrane protein YfcA
MRLLIADCVTRSSAAARPMVAALWSAASASSLSIIFHSVLGQHPAIHYRNRPTWVTLKGMSTLLLALTALLTALLSGVFGMAGGMVLMGVYAALLPVPTAMVMHGGTQLVANGSRALILRREVYWRGFRFYVAGALVAFGALFSLHYVPDPLVVFLGLGLAPFLAPLVPERLMNFERPTAALLCGFNVAAVQLLAGAAGPLLDVAFVRTTLTRHQVVATKAVTQVFSHMLKLAYFIPALEGGHITPALVALVLLATLVGTRLGTLVLARMSDDSFRRYTRWLISSIGVVYLCKAALLMLS